MTFNERITQYNKINKYKYSQCKDLQTNNCQTYGELADLSH